MTGLRTTALKFAAFVAASAVLLVLLVNTMVNGLGAESRTVTATFSDVSGLRPGDDVRVAGVRVGRVESIAVSDDGQTAQVRLEVVDEQPLLDTTTVVMRYQNLLGQRYLALVQEGPRGEPLESGARIPLARTSPGFDLTELLNGFRPLFEVLEPAEVNELSTSMIKVLQGEGGTVETLLAQTAELTTFLADRDELVGEVLTNLTPVLENIAGQDAQVAATVRELRLMMTGLARDRQAIGDAVDGVGRLVGSTSSLLTELRGPADVAFARFAQVARLLAQNRQRLNRALRSFGGTFEALGRGTSYESALNVYVCSLAFALGETSLNPAGGDGPWSEVCR